MDFCEQLKSDFEKFLLFQCENKQMNPEELISSTINLMKNCVSSREAILQFYYQFFDELCLLYVNKQNLNNITINHLLFRFLKYYIESETKIKKFGESEKNNQVNSLNDTPLSPPIYTEQNLNVETFFLTIEKFVKRISSTLQELLEEDDCSSKKSIVNWTLKILATVTANYSASDEPKLNETIKIWTNCNAILYLLNLIKSYILVDLFENIESVLTKLIELLPNSNWVTAYLITSLPNDSNKLSHCLKFLLSSTTSPNSITCILSYLSEHNPQAIIKSSKTDIPFLLKLSTTSKPLLNLLALEAINEVNINMLNNLKLKENLLTEVLYCILNAPNSFELLNLLFELNKNPKANSNVKQQSFLILESITYKLHQAVYCVSCEEGLKLPILNELKKNSKNFICNMFNNTEPISQKLQIRILNLLCVHFGIEYATEIIFNVLNNLNPHFDNDVNISNQANALLIHLLKSLKLPFGSNLQICFQNFIENSFDKNPRFWANLLNILETDINIIIDLDIISVKFAEQMQDKPDFYSLYYLLLLIQSCLKKYPKKASKPNHHLCISLVGCMIQVIDSLYKMNDINVKIKIITTIQKCMLILSKSQIANQHIICRCLLESELNSKEKILDEDENHNISLMKENCNFSSSFKFRKVSLGLNVGFKKGNENNDFFLRKQIILDTIRCCFSENTTLLASLLVESTTPDVMFNDKSWPDEDFLKVTIERDLHISRKFEFNPILWNLCELVAKDGFLQNCSVLIRALLAVNLTQWASKTANKEKLKSTEKLIKLISQSEIVPKIVFKDLHLVLNYLDSWEIYCLLNDLWRYLKDNTTNSDGKNLKVVKIYFQRLRMIGGRKFPGVLFIKIFKNFNI